MFKIVLIAIFFSVDISYVISELLKRAELRRFAKLVEIPVPCAFLYLTLLYGT